MKVTDGYRIPDWQYGEAGEGETGGVLINLSPTGRVEIREGLAQHAIDADTAEAIAENPIAPKKPKAAYSAPLCRYIAHHKTAAVQEVLLADPRKAREMAAIALFSGLIPHEVIPALSRESEPQRAYAVLEAQARLYAGKLGFEIDTGDSVWRQFPPRPLDVLDLYKSMKALSDHDLDGLHTLLTALAFGQDVCERLETHGSLFNRVAADLGVDMRNHWRPDRSFLERRNRDQLAVIAQECGYGLSASAIRSCKKAELVSGLLRHFANAHTATDPTPAQRKAREWLPEAMLFPAVDPDAQERPDTVDADEQDGADPVDEAA